jgi:hypothetical protein
LNPLEPEDPKPPGITWVASRLLELVAALLDPVLLDTTMFPKDQFPTTVLIEGYNHDGSSCQIYLTETRMPGFLKMVLWASAQQQGLFPQ